MRCVGVSCCGRRSEEGLGVAGRLGTMEGRRGLPAFVHLIYDAGGATGVLFALWAATGAEGGRAVQAEGDAGCGVGV